MIDPTAQQPNVTSAPNPQGTPTPQDDPSQQTSQQPQAQQPQQGSVSASNGAQSQTQPQDSGLQPQTSSVNATVPKVPLSQASVPPPVHPAVQHANILRETAMALAGGPRYQTTVDANTGQITKTPVPLSKADIGMAIVSSLLSGGLAGLSVRPGPGAVGRAAGAGYEQVSGQRQQADQEQQQQAQTDLANQTHALAAKAAAAEQGSRTILNTQQAERMGVENLKDAVSQNADLLKSYDEAGEVQDHNISQDQLMAGLKSGKYSSTSQIALPDGFTNINGKYEQTFAIVQNPNAKVPLTQEQWDALADANVQGFAKGVKIPDGYQITGSQLAIANQKAQANKLMQQDVSQVATALEGSGNEAYQEMGKGIPDFGKLLSNPQTGPTLQNALGKFQRYISHSNLHGMDLYQSLQQMAQPSKPDPQHQGQFIPNPDAPLASTIAGAFGGNDPQKGWQILKAFHDEMAPVEIKNVAGAEAILSDPASSSNAKEQAQRFIDLDTKTKAAEKAAGITPEQRTEQNLRIQKLQDDIKNNAGGGGADGPDYFKNDPELGPLADPKNVSPDGINHKFLDAIRQQDPGMSNLALRMVQGLDLYSTYGMARNVGEKLGALVSSIAPGFSKGQAEAFFETQKKYAAGGRMGQTLAAGNTAFEHLNSLYQNAGALETVGPLRPFGSDTQQQGRFDTVKNQAATEVASYYANGLKPNEQDIEDNKKGYSGLPNKVRAGIQYQAEKLMDKVQENYNVWRSEVPSSFVPPVPFVTPQGARAYKALTGRDVNPELMQSAHTIGDNAAPGSKIPLANGVSPENVPAQGQVPTGSFAIRNAAKQVVGYQTPGQKPHLF